VLSHELAHLHQRQVGAYAGGVEPIELKLDREAKLSSLREACDPVSTRREEEADEIALQVLIRLLAQPPYRETILSECGSLYWNIDLLALGSDAWQKHVIEREAISQPTMHASFDPSQFPTPVCAENLIRVDSVTESHNHRCDGCAAISTPQSVGLAFQVDQPA
jgi:hypothetical protein